MKALLVLGLLWALGGGDRERGLLLYQQGDYAGAAEAFAAALRSEGDSPELHYNLALCRWRLGQLDEARQAADRMAALAAEGFGARHQGILGGVRHDESVQRQQQAERQKAEPGQLEAAVGSLEQALTLAREARDHFVRGAATTEAGPELARNLERELQRIAQLEQKLEEWKKELEQQKQDQQKQDEPQKDQQQDPKQDEKNQDQPKQGEQKPDEAQQDPPKQDPKDPSKPDPQQGQQTQDPSKSDARPEPQPEPKPDPPQGQGAEPPPDPQGEPKPEPKPDAGDPLPEVGPGSADKRRDAPGEQQQGELSPEETARLLEILEQLDGRLQEHRARARAARKPVGRDW